MSEPRAQIFPINQIIHEAAELWVPPKSYDPIVVAERKQMRPGQLLDDAVVIGGHCIESIVRRAKTIDEREYLEHRVGPALIASGILARVQRETFVQENRMGASIPIPKVYELRARDTAKALMKDSLNELVIGRKGALAKSRAHETDYKVQERALMKSAQKFMKVGVNVLILNEIDSLRRQAEYLSRREDIQWTIRSKANIATGNAIKRGHTIAALSDLDSAFSRDIERNAPRTFSRAVEKAREQRVLAFHPGEMAV